MKNKDTIKVLMQAFSCGISQGLLFAENERDSEETFNAFMGATFDKKFAMPMQDIQRRELHGKKWHDHHKKEVEKFYNLLAKIV